jgi:hypothetical protein
VTANSDAVAEAAQSLADRRAAAAEKPGITQLILAVLSPFPYGLTTREIRGTYRHRLVHASAKLSKLAAYGVIEKFTTAGDYRHRWRVKPSQPGCSRLRT